MQERITQQGWDGRQIWMGIMLQFKNSFRRVDPSKQQQQCHAQKANAPGFSLSKGVECLAVTASTIERNRYCGTRDPRSWASIITRWWQRRRQIGTTGRCKTISVALNTHYGMGEGSRTATIGGKMIKSPTPLKPQWRRAGAWRASSARGLIIYPLLVCLCSSSDHSNLRSSVLVRGASVSVGFGGGCPNACSSHGYCTGPATETCECHQGWAGGDCSIRLCPSGTAWVDRATANNTAHAALTECSNMGVCDRTTGRCTCRDGFTGEACQRMACPRDCGGQGRCMSMREAAALIDGGNLGSEGVYNGWDADMIHGCVCDDGWEGYDCSLRACPKGIDPYPEIDGVDEEQLIDCYCPDQCSGSLQLAFRGHSTRPIPFDSSAELVKYRLEELDTVDHVMVNITGTEGTICGGNSGATTRVTFLLQHGVLSNMTAVAGTLVSTTSSPFVGVFAKGYASSLNPHLWSQVSTKDAQECSARGLCNRLTGHCSCYPKFRSSNGLGGEGDLGDCGYYDWHDPPMNCTTTVPVWGSVAALCSGVGDCNETSWRCNCTEGYTGGACERRECGSGVAWFEEVALNVTSATEGGRNGLPVMCSAGGVCDESTGNCSCLSGMFDGDACDVLACPTCSDLGTCEDMEHFATAVVNGQSQERYTYDLWDANKMRSCWCNQSMSVSTMFSGISTTFRGPYALADTDSRGYDCSLARCPTGDHLHTDGVTDIQRVNCTGHSGVFKLVFRGEPTAELDFFINAANLEAALEATPWILDVSVTFTTGTTSACNDTEYIDIEFLTENGDLPLMESNSEFLFLEDGTTQGSVTVAKIQTGTREDVECSAHGICLEEEGVCDCFVGYQSGDNAGGGGERGDCSWRNKHQTALFVGDEIAYDYN